MVGVGSWITGAQSSEGIKEVPVGPGVKECLFSLWLLGSPCALKLHTHLQLRPLLLPGFFKETKL